jgi:hypothetical protein
MRSLDTVEQFRLAEERQQARDQATRFGEQMRRTRLLAVVATLLSLASLLVTILKS